MDHGRSLGSIENDKLQEACRAVGTKDEIPRGIVPDLFDHDCVSQSVQDVLRVDIVSRRGSKNLHTSNRTTKRLTTAEPIASYEPTVRHGDGRWVTGVTDSQRSLPSPPETGSEMVLSWLFRRRWHPS